MSRSYFLFRNSLIDSVAAPLLENKTISDGGITVDFSIIKVHTSNLNSPWIIRGLGIIEILRIIKFHIFLFLEPLDHRRLGDYQIILNYHTIFPFNRNTFG